MQQGPSRLWHRYHPEFLLLETTSRRQWLVKEFDFCFDNGIFDATKFIGWYDQAETFDKNCWFKHFSMQEQVSVLKIWSEQNKKPTVPTKATLPVATPNKFQAPSKPKKTNSLVKGKPSKSVTPAFLFEFKMLEEKEKNKNDNISTQKQHGHFIKSRKQFL